MKDDKRKEQVLSTFYAGLDRAIAKKGWTRNQLKKASGVNLERYKAGEDAREPSLSSAVKMADALGVSLDSLCGRADYACDKAHMTAGECLDVLLSLVEQLLGRISEDGLTIDLPESNVTNAIRDSFQYANFLQDGQKFKLKNFPNDVEAAKHERLTSQIEALKAEKVPVEVTSFNGRYRVGDRIIETVQEDEDLPF